MKKTLQLVAIFGVSSLAAQAQTTPPARRPAQQSDTAAAVARHRAQHYTGPKVVENTKELGQKFRRHSKPTDGQLRMIVQPK